MQSQSRFFDDLAQLMTSAMGVAQGAQQEAQSVLKNHFDRLMSDYNLVTREEFDVVREMAVRARQENETLTQKTRELEAHIERLTKELTALNSKTANEKQDRNQVLSVSAAHAAQVGRARKKAVNKVKRY